MIEFGWDYDVDSVCRICLQDSKDLTSIYECNDASDNTLLLFEKIEKIGGIKIISDPVLPSSICRKCNAFLNVAHKFRIICRRSDNYLREFVYKASGSLSQTTSETSDEDEEELQQTHESGTEAPLEEYLVGYEDDINNETAATSGDVYEIDTIENIVEQEEVVEEEHQDNNSTTEVQYTELWLNENTVANDELVTNKRDSSSESVKECSEKINNTNIVKSIETKPLDISTEETVIGTSIDNNTATDEAPAAVLKATKLKNNQKYAHVCNICGNSYPRKYSLDSHMRRHRGIRPYECEICHATFHLNFELTRHIRKHTGDRPYKCQYCERCFADRSTLVKHERIHTNERPYACETCGKTFTYSSVLKVHKMTHTGEKPFNCGICNKRFTRGHHLRAHLETQLHQNDPRTTKLLKLLKRDCND